MNEFIGEKSALLELYLRMAFLWELSSANFDQPKIRVL